jgi:photoactive yellow protein
MKSSHESATLFEDPDIVSRVEALSPAELDALPFGVIKLDAAGAVSFFSQTEARQSGYGDRPAIGRQFFTELAPCMGTPEFMSRVEQAHAERTLDILFEHVGDFGDASRVLRIRLKAANDGGTWVLIQR